MAEIHLVQWTALFVLAMALTAAWLLTRPPQRWRHIISALVSTLLWIIIAYTAGNVGVASNGEVVTFGSDAVAMFAVFMVFVDLIGLLLGLWLWGEAETREASHSLPTDMRRPGD